MHFKNNELQLASHNSLSPYFSFNLLLSGQTPPKLSPLHHPHPKTASDCSLFAQCLPAPTCALATEDLSLPGSLVFCYFIPLPTPQILHYKRRPRRFLGIKNTYFSFFCWMLVETAASTGQEAMTFSPHLFLSSLHSPPFLHLTLK